MQLGSTPDMLVVVDNHPSSSAGQTIAHRYAAQSMFLTGWDVDRTELGDSALVSASAEPTIAEALRIAAQNRIGWIALRRDIEAPERLLGGLLVAAAHQRQSELPGFAVLLADGDPKPFRRIAGIVDRRGGPASGLLAHVAVSLAARAGAELDVLVIGNDDADLSQLGPEAIMAINREEELFQAARELARSSGLQTTWVPINAGEDPWPAITDILDHGEYDLVVDDLGDISLGRRGGLDASIDGVLAPGEIGEIPLRLLREFDVPLLLVIDEIRLGLLPAGVLRAGAAAAISLGIASSTVLPLAPPAAASQPRRDADVPSVGDLLQEALDEASTSTADRSADASGTSRAITVTAARAQGALTGKKAASTPDANQKVRKVSAPKGGADPTDVAKARRAAQRSKADLDQAKKDKAKAQTAVDKAEESVVKAEKRAAKALTAIEATGPVADAAQADAERAASQATGLASMLPGGATELDAAVLQADSDQAEAEYLEAVLAGGDALMALTSAQLTLADQEFRLDQASAEAKEAKAGYSFDREKFDVYRESLASTRQSPVAKGSYRLTARFGQAGGYWSSGVHTGLDFAGKTGMDILAAASGTVVSAGYEGSYGNRVVVDHGRGYKTTYNHMSAIKVSVGDKVSTGDRIGDLGGTGNVTGPHLHFEVTRNGKFVDPQAWLGW